MSLAWEPNNLEAEKRALEAAMESEEIDRQIAYLEQDLARVQREIKAEQWARGRAKDISDYEELKACYMKAAEELQDSCGSVEGHAGSAGTSAHEVPGMTTIKDPLVQRGGDLEAQSYRSGYQAPPAGKKRLSVSTNDGEPDQAPWPLGVPRSGKRGAGPTREDSSRDIPLPIGIVWLGVGMGLIAAYMIWMVL